jgi:hypothetical protein
MYLFRRSGWLRRKTALVGLVSCTDQYAFRGMKFIPSCFLKGGPFSVKAHPQFDIPT